MLTFESTYYEGEVRDGFYITSLMKRCWAAQLDILKEVEKVCKNHNIKYFAEYGTLLGAVRHQGYIPWDDDLDIAMSRKDLNIFLKYASNELPKEFKVYTPTDNFDQFVVKVLNTNKLEISLSQMEKFHGFPFVAGIDIFIYDDLPKDAEEEESLRLLIGAVHSLGYHWDRESGGTEEEKLNMLKELGELCNYQFNENESYKVQLIHLSQYLSCCYADDTAKEVAIIFRLLDKPACKCQKSYIEDLIEVPFENISIPIPKKYDEILKAIYGNYMEFQRGTAQHDYPYYKKQQKKLLQRAKDSNVKLPEYFYEGLDRN